jgi:hypothetical protein
MAAPRGTLNFWLPGDYAEQVRIDLHDSAECDFRLSGFVDVEIANAATFWF